MQTTLTSLLKKHGLNISPAWNSGFVRNGSQWFTGRQSSMGDREIQWAAFGDFARNISETWTSADKLSADEQKQVNEFIKQAQAENRAERERHWAQVQVEVEKEWDSFSDLGKAPYAERKGFRDLHGCRVEPHTHGARLIVPARDADGKLWGYQRIYSEKLSLANTDKIFREGARKEGCFHTLGTIGNAPSVLYVCEGISTAVAVFESLGREHPVISVFDAGNLGYVARSLRDKYKDAHLVFCADNDQWPSKDGQVYHTGKRKADAAAKAVGNARVVLPHFMPAQAGERPTDFDDLMRLTNPDEVRRQILEPTDLGTELRPLEARTATGLSTKPSERMVAMTLLRHYGENLVCQDQDVFIYGDGYWAHQTRDGVKALKRQIAHLYGAKAGSKDIEAAYKYFLIHAPTPPPGRNLFTPPYFAANFRNGTLHFLPEPGGKPKLAFREHNREDYLITQLPFDYPTDIDTARNPEFDAMLERVFKGDPDKDDKIRVLAQMFGAVVMPCYSKLFFLVGKKGSGKSTICKLLYRLADPRNVSHVDPSSFHGFNMETMVGKLLNMDTDIDLHKPINDALIKKITDRIKFRIARKYQTDIEAPLAPIHVFGGNDLPKSLEGATGAYERRVVIIKFGAFSAEALGAGNYDLDYDEFVWRQGWAAILAFALRGLRDLLESKGHFHVPESSKAMLKEWDERSDMLSQFFDSMDHGELDKGNQYKRAPESRISRKNFWEAFNDWQQHNISRSVTWNERQLCNAMRAKGYQEYRTKSERGWIGVGTAPAAESAV